MLLIFRAVLLFSLTVPATSISFTDNSLRTIQLSETHTEELPLSAIERLRHAVPLPRPLDRVAYAAARATLSNISIAFDHSSVSDLAIETIQGRFDRKLWGAGYIDVTETMTTQQRESKVAAAAMSAVTAPTYPIVNASAHPELIPMLALVTAAEIKSYVSSLSTSFATRYYKSTIARRKSPCFLICLLCLQ